MPNRLSIAPCLLYIDPSIQHKTFHCFSTSSSYHTEPTIFSVRSSADPIVLGLGVQRVCIDFNSVISLFHLIHSCPVQKERVGVDVDSHIWRIFGSYATLLDLLFWRMQVLRGRLLLLPSASFAVTVCWRDSLSRKEWASHKCPRVIGIFHDISTLIWNNWSHSFSWFSCSSKLLFTVEIIFNPKMR